MLAKLIVTAESREAAVAKMQSALHEFEVRGIATNIPFLRRLVTHPRYVAGDFHTGFVPQFLAESHG